MTKQFQTAFIDTLIVLLLTVFAMLMIAAHKPTPTSTNTDPSPVNAGTITVVATWDNARDDDIDMWIESPDGSVVGFPQKHGVVFDLLRDDIGKSSDPGQINMENAYSRGAPAGEYTVNLHWYRAAEQGKPETVHVIVQMRTNPTASTTTIFEGDATLKRQGLEVTAIRFTLNGQMVLEGTTKLPKCIAQPTSGSAVLCGE